MSGNTGSGDGAELNVDGHGVMVRNELLCFVQQKCDLLTADDLIKVCTDFYSLDEIEQARVLISKFVPAKRVSKPKGSDLDVAVKSMNILLKICLDPLVKLPAFFAVNLARLPPVDVSHVDVSAILQELSALRREVRVVEQLRQEIAQLKQAIHPAEGSFSHSMSGGEDKAQPKIGAFKSFAQMAGDLVINGISDSGKNRAASTRKAVVGTSVTNNHVRAVETKRVVELFVSRLHPETHINELLDCVNDTKGDIRVLELGCEKLSVKPGNEHLYASFCVRITVSSCHFKAAIDRFSAEESWPIGIYVRRYFKPKVSIPNHGVTS